MTGIATTRFSIALAAVMLASLPALAGTRIERTFDLGPGGELELDAAHGSVTVIGTSSSEARVLITSRDPNWRGTARLLTVQVWTRPESMAFLRRRTGD